MQSVLKRNDLLSVWMPNSTHRSSSSLFSEQEEHNRAHLVDQLIEVQLTEVKRKGNLKIIFRPI
jgi:hypothetical protein